MLVQKKARQVHAWCLGAGSEEERRLTALGKIRLEADGTYRIFSQENDTEGQIAQPGDYFKVDSTGAPYPNSRDYFLNNHTHIEGNCYLQTSPVLKGWTLDAPMCPEINYLLGSGKLMVDESSDSHYFTAFMWGVWLHAARNAVIIIDSVTESGGKIVDAAFHFITREEFDLTYQIIES